MRKKIVILMLVFSLGFSVPLYATQSAALVLWVVKEFGLDLVARAIARRLLTTLQNGVINSINNIGVEDGQKAPSFVQNWKKFLADAQNIGENQFRAQLNYSIKKGILCDDLKGPLALAFQASNAPFVDIGATDKNAELKQGSLIPYQTKIKCTIPDKVRAEFKKDFAKGGGWETWTRLVEPQNNLAGALAISLEELNKQRGSQENARRSEVVAGQGFIGVQSPACRGTSNVRSTVCYNNCYDPLLRACNVIPDLSRKNSCISDADNTCTARCQGETSVGAGAQCTFLGKTVTPAKILGEGAAQWLDDNSKWLVTSDELSEVLVSILNAALSKIQNFLVDKAVGALTGSGGGQAGETSEDRKADQSGGKTAGAEQDCISACVANASNKCSNPLSTPEEKKTCEDDNQRKCEQHCAVPGSGQ